MNMNKLEKTREQYVAPESVVKELIMSKMLLQGSIFIYGKYNCLKPKISELNLRGVCLHTSWKLRR